MLHVFHGIDLKFVYFLFMSCIQIGTWNSTKRATMFENISSNMGIRSYRETLEGRKLRVVVAEVMNVNVDEKGNFSKFGEFKPFLKVPLK